MTQTQLVKIDPKEFGLEENKAAEIAAQFKPMLDKMVELESEYNQIINLPIEEDSTAEKAKSLRLKYVKVRTGTAEIHKQQKAFYLAGGKFVDGWKNAQLFASQGIEEKLEAIEKYQEIQEAKRIESLKHQRMIELTAYEVDGSLMALGNMSDDIWNNYLAGVKMNYEAKKEAERKANEARIENERLDKVEQERKLEIAPYAQFNSETNDLRSMSEERYVELLGNCQKAKIDYLAEQEKIRLENEALRKAAEEKEKQLEAERHAAAKEKAAAENKARIIAQVAESEARKLKELSDAKIKAEKDKADALAAQLKAKSDAEEAERKQEAAALKKAQAAPDKEKLKLLAKRLTETEFPLLKTKEANDILKQVEILLNKTSEYINSKLNTL